MQYQHVFLRILRKNHTNLLYFSSTGREKKCLFRRNERQKTILGPIWPISGWHAPAWHSFCSPDRNVWSLCVQIRGSTTPMGSSVHQKILPKGFRFTELAKKIVTFFWFSRLLRSRSDDFLLSYPQSFDVLHQIWHLCTPHALYLLAKNYAVMFICHGVSPRKAPLRRFRARSTQLSQSTFLFLLSAILGLFRSNFGVRLRSCPLAFDKKWSTQLVSSRSYTQNTSHFSIFLGIPCCHGRLFLFS